jgi:hypothetical protein
MSSMHQWRGRISQGRGGGRQVKYAKKADSQMIKVSESITNSVIIDPIERQYGAIMTIDSLDNKGGG